MTIQRKEVFADPSDGHARPERAAAAATPVVSWAVIAACVALFIFELFLVPTGGEGQAHPFALVGSAVAAGQWWRVLGTVFEHGGAFHLFMNMSVMFTLGMPLERSLGSSRFAVLSLATALGASAFTLLFDFARPTVGASGMILGYAGAMLPIARPEFRRSLLIWLGQIALISLLPFVSWSGHLGGFVFGLLCGLGLRQSPRRFTSIALGVSVLAAGLCFWAVSLGGSLVHRAL